MWLQRPSLQSVELSQRLQTAVHIVSKPSAPSNGVPIYRFGGKPAMRTRWRAGAAPHKNETNPGPTTTHKQVWICDICHKQIHGRKHVLTGLIQPKTNPLIHSPPLHPRRPEPNTYASHILDQPLSSHAPPSSIARQLR